MIKTSSMLLILFAMCSPSFGQDKRMVTARDCVQAKYLLDQDGETSIRISPDGLLSAYLVKSPNLETNDNDVALYVSPLRDTGDTSGRLIDTTPQLSQIRWLADGRHIAALAPVSGHVGLVLYDSDSGKREVLVSGLKDIEEYTIDAEGNTIVFAIREDISKKLAHSADENADGYRVPNDSMPSTALMWRSPWMPFKLWMKRKRFDGSWSEMTVVTLHSPFTGKPFETVGMSPNFALSLSPDGRKLIANIDDVDMTSGKEINGDKLPEEWLESATYRRRLQIGGSVWITLLQDLQTGGTSMPFPTPSAAGVPKWTQDGSEFYIVANSPVGSMWERSDEVTHPNAAKPWHIWRVKLGTVQPEKIFSGVKDPTRALLWVEPSKIGIRTGPRQITTMVRGESQWTVESERVVGPEGATSYSEIASNGSETVLNYQRSDTPPELLFYHKSQKEPRAVVSLNPQFSHVQFARALPFQWKISDGATITGSLLMPPDYQVGKRYPLVIQTKPQQADFVCDAGPSHFPSFAPQPMAIQGLVYLMLSAPQALTPHFPQGLPGQVNEAVFFTDVWDSAVKELDRLAIIDPSKVGLIGYSRSGWYTEFALYRGITRFAAATATDNAQYSLGGYWLDKTSMATSALDEMYGGHPYGEALKNWMQYSISFNMDKIHTPLLLEAMGSNVADDTVGEVPMNLVSRYELVTALNRLKKPVELYYYPQDEHQPDHPRARLASIQRNVDWYRFWLQGYERPDPEDPDQYKRWEELRDRRDADAKEVHATSGNSLRNK